MSIITQAMEIFIEGKANHLVFGSQPNKAKLNVYLSKNMSYAPSAVSRSSSYGNGGYSTFTIDTLVDFKKVSCQWQVNTNGTGPQLTITTQSKEAKRSVVWYQYQPNTFKLYEHFEDDGNYSDDSDDDNYEKRLRARIYGRPIYEDERGPGVYGELPERPELDKFYGDIILTIPKHYQDITSSDIIHKNIIDWLK